MSFLMGSFDSNVSTHKSGVNLPTQIEAHFFCCPETLRFRLQTSLGGKKSFLQSAKFVIRFGLVFLAAVK